MSRPLRIVFEGNMSEITVRCFQGRLLLRPSPELNRVFIGVLARAQERYPVKIHAVSVMSSHFHLLITACDAEQQKFFMQYLDCNVSKEVGRLHDWKGGMWQGRFHSVAVAEQLSAQIGRFEYNLEQGCKEGLVARPSDWPGINCAQALVEGKPLKGIWYSRTDEFAARNAGKEFRPGDYATEYEVHLDPLPCWAHLEPEEYRRRVKEIVDRIEKDTADHHRRMGTVPAGSAAVLRRHPHERPEKLKRSPAPFVHAASKKARWEFYNAYQAVVVAYHAAAEMLREGRLDVKFPEGCFPPPQRFVRPLLSG